MPNTVSHFVTFMHLQFFSHPIVRSISSIFATIWMYYLQIHHKCERTKLMSNASKIQTNYNFIVFHESIKSLILDFIHTSISTGVKKLAFNFDRCSRQIHICHFSLKINASSCASPSQTCTFHEEENDVNQQQNGHAILSCLLLQNIKWIVYYS